MLAVVLAALVVTSPVTHPPAPSAVTAVPDEPRAVVLPEAPTFQAVAADLDGDGTRDLLRLVRGQRGLIAAEAWVEAPGLRWQMADRIEVIPETPTGAANEVVWAGTPARLLVRSIGGADRVTLVRQPRHQEPGIDDLCCLSLDDLVVRDGDLRLESVTPPGDGVSSILVIDFDGDGTDELLTSRPLPPLGDVEISAQMSVFRWQGDRFAAPVVTTLPIPPRAVPFVLGDTDGLPGYEAGVLGPTLQRIALDEGDSLNAEDSGLAARSALGVSVEGGRAIALAGPSAALTLRSWPGDALPSEPISQATIADASLLGEVEIRGQPHLVVRQPALETLHVLALPSFEPLRGDSITRGPAAAALELGPVQAYVGPLPGGGRDGDAAVIFAGRLLPSSDDAGGPDVVDATEPIATLAGTRPVGLVGRGRVWLALLHAPLTAGSAGTAGGALTAPTSQPGSGVSLVAVWLALEPEVDGAAFSPPIAGATAIDGRDTLAVGPRGFVASVSAPPGSRIYIGDSDPSVLGSVSVVPESGTLDVAMVPPAPAVPNGRIRVGLSVVTPAGHAYAATWVARVLTAAPPLEALVETPFGSAEVTVEGTTAPYATVTVAGQSVPVAADGAFVARVDLPPWPTTVAVSATDPVGNVAIVRLSGVGIFDYRGLPWIPIAISLVALAAAILVLRVPRLRAPARRIGDDAVLEELDPD